MKLYIFRHGATYEALHNIAYTVDSRINADILENQKSAIEKLAFYLKDIPSDVHITSPFKRCLQTVEIVTNITGKEFEKDPLLGEYMEESETFEEMAARVKTFYRQILTTNHQDLLICTHGAIIAGLKSMFEIGDYPLHRLTDYPISGTLLILDFEEKTSRLIDFN